MKISENLLDKYKKGTATEEEKALVLAWYNQFFIRDENLSLETLNYEHDEGLKNLNLAINKRNVRVLWQKVAVAACILIGLLTFIFIDIAKKDQVLAKKTDSIEDTTAPLLILSDGTKINLSEDNIGEITEEQGVKISKAIDGSLVYTIIDQNEKTVDAKKKNTIETPYGIVFQVNLPDGSKVWLNSRSKLIYPIQFSKDEPRIVELEGEAYFEIAKGKDFRNSNKRQPFLVKSKGQVVHVLGTHFNVSAYTGEKNIETTLLEGVVRVESEKSNVILSPGQQSSLSLHDQAIAVSEINIENEIAWKNGYFHFDNESIVEVMKELSRWYDIEVEYKSEVSSQKIGGTFSKSKNIKELLASLETLGGLKFEIEGRRVIVMQ